MAIKVLINAGAGRMGRRILALLLEDSELSLAGVREMAGHPSQGQDAGTLIGTSELGVKVIFGQEEPAIEPEVVIDFSMPKATIEIARVAAERKWPLVIGTTGLSEAEKHKLQQYQEGLPWVLAPNMSVGVNLLFKLAADVTRILGDSFDIDIVEAHHRFKADAPSGTAVRLGEEIARARGVELTDKACYGRQGRPGARPADEIGILAVRAGDIVGEHTVIFGSLGERIELVHKAHTRDNFALGALRAAKWIIRQPPGLYDMMDVLGLR